MVPGAQATLGRLGGTEFDVLVPHSDDVARQTEMLRATVAATLVSGLPAISARIGAAVATASANDWLRVADRAP